MRKPFYSIVSNKAATTGEILIYGVIGADFWGDGNDSKQFVQDINLMAKTCKTIHAKINSPGGSVWDGLPMFNAMRALVAQGIDLHTWNDGICFSMGAILLLAGSTVHVSKNSLSMIHNAGGIAMGNSRDMREYADLLDVNDDVLAGIIADRSGKTVADVKSEWMNYNDNFLTAQQMIDGGLADVLEDYEAKDMPANAKNMTTNQIAAFYLDRMEEPSESMIEKIRNKLSIINPQNIDMKFPKIFSLKGQKKPSAALLAECKAELEAEGLEGYGIYPDAEITNAATLGTENTRLTDELEATGEKLVKAEAKVEKFKKKAEKQAEEISDMEEQIEELEEKVEAFGKNPGAVHKAPKNSVQVQPDANDSADPWATINALKHNQDADKLIGAPKVKDPAAS